MKASANYPSALLLAFALWWSLLALAPSYRQDWLLENLLVFIAVPLLVWSYPRLRLSNLSYSLIFVFLCLHEVGAHYTYAEVPYAAWYRQLTGSEFPHLIGGHRNQFDRLVHFLYGLLMMPAIIELLQARAAPPSLRPAPP
jgi:putative membrane protein